MKSYDKKFYEDQCKDNMSSAGVIVSLLIEMLNTRGINVTSVIDLGCGSGNWLSIFKQRGIEVRGVDFGNISDKSLMISREEYVRHDFSKKYRENRRYSISMSLECAEHIEEKYARGMVDSLMDLSDIVLFSAAIPHQRGRGHINEQYQSYWIEFFERRNFQVFDVIRNKVWNDKKVRGFYAQNVFLFVNRNSVPFEKLKPVLGESGLQLYNVIHPEVWEQVNNYKLVKLMDRIHENRAVAWMYYKFFKKPFYKKK